MLAAWYAWVFTGRIEYADIDIGGPVDPGGLRDAGERHIFHDMASNSFMDVQAELVPSDVAGRWTGVSGPVMMTLDLQQDGKGIACTAWGTNNSGHAIKYSGGTIYDQGGTRIDVSLQGDRLNASYPYRHGPSFQLHRDDDLAKAAPYCRQSM